MAPRSRLARGATVREIESGVNRGEVADFPNLETDRILTIPRVDSVNAFTTGN
jgi:hypothetical protein